MNNVINGLLDVVSETGIIEPAGLVVIPSEHESNAILQHKEDENNDGEDVEYIAYTLATSTPSGPQ